MPRTIYKKMPSCLPVLARLMGVFWLLFTLMSGTAAAGGANNINTIAGTGVPGYSGDGGISINAQIQEPVGVTQAPDGGIIFSHFGDHDNGPRYVRKIAPNWIMSTIAGNGVDGYSGDGGPATSAAIRAVGIDTTPDGGYIFADQLNHRIRKVSPSGTITTVAGTGVAGFSGDGGPATSAQIELPEGVASLPDGGFLIADNINNRIRKVSPSGTITTVAGNGTFGYSGDGGPATSAAILFPFDVEPCPPGGAGPCQPGGFLISDRGNNRVRYVNPSGIIQTWAGTGTAGYSGDNGYSIFAQLNRPMGLAIVPDGGFLVADSLNHRARHQRDVHTVDEEPEHVVERRIDEVDVFLGSEYEVEEQVTARGAITELKVEHQHRRIVGGLAARKEAIQVAVPRRAERRIDIVVRGIPDTPAFDAIGVRLRV